MTAVVSTKLTKTRTRKYYSNKPLASFGKMAEMSKGKDSYSRTQNRRDFSLEPYGKILLDVLFGNNIPTIGISSENPFQIKLLPKIIETLNDGDRHSKFFCRFRKNNR
ncbi:MAG: hypothetical protein KKG06_08120 [Bacteroidetes bacterium]|nr:hypothetical protein [Bacteroidota bacterium]MBU1423129.1 hypothetical protein [Bacteroidota bacterium]